MTAYYNEIEPYAAQWLRNLIAAGHIAPGEVDERSIRDVAAEDIAGFTQSHFFAGIGVWFHALRLAGWPDDRPVWTGSCPCQPFSAAGRGGGFADERHLWPEFARLIGKCQPATVFGEQVASALGRAWFTGVRSDMETLGYAVGGADLCAAGVGAPHIRQRIFWVGNAGGYRLRVGGGQAAEQPIKPSVGPIPGAWGASCIIECLDGFRRRIEPGIEPVAPRVASTYGRLRAYGNAIVAPLAGEFIAAVMDCQP